MNTRAHHTVFANQAENRARLHEFHAIVLKLQIKHNLPMNKTLQYIKRFAGIGNDQTSHVEKLISGLGGFVAILLILLVTRQFLQVGNTLLIVASMGASAVLLFAVPHGPLSQPWPLAGGHLLSAFVGVSCYT